MAQENLLGCEIAEQFLRDTSSVSLYAYTEIEADAAAILAQHEGELSLPGLTALSEEAAESLCAHRQKSFFPNRLFGGLDLSGLETISNPVAQQLAGYPETLLLNGFKTASDSLLDVLSTHRGPCLSLSGLKAISVKGAASLALHQGRIELNGLHQLSAAVATELCNHTGVLSLKGIDSLDGPVAEILARHKGRLVLSPSVYEEVLSYRGQLTGEIVQAFLAGEREIDLRIYRRIKFEHAEALSRYEGEVDLSGLTFLCSDSAEALERLGGRLVLGLGQVKVRGATVRSPEITSTHSGFPRKFTILMAVEHLCGLFDFRPADTFQNPMHLGPEEREVIVARLAMARSADIGEIDMRFSLVAMQQLFCVTDSTFGAEQVLAARHILQFVQDLAHKHLGDVGYLISGDDIRYEFFKGSDGNSPLQTLTTELVPLITAHEIAESTINERMGEEIAQIGSEICDLWR